MDNKNVVIDIKSIESTKKIMDEQFLALLSLLKDYREMIEDTKRIYDTESGTLYRTLASSYVDYVEEYLNKEFKPYVDKLDEIRNIYINEFNTVSQSLGGGN